MRLQDIDLFVRILTVRASSRQDCAPEPVEVQWKLGEDNMSIQQYIYPPPATQVSRKRSNTVSSINPRPRRKARSSAVSAETCHDLLCGG